MSDYTPTTEMVEGLYLEGAFMELPHDVSVHHAAFNRWLASVKAEVWDEGARWSAVEFQTSENTILKEADVLLAPGDNPYRSEQ